MRKILALLLIATAPFAFADESIVFVGTPASRVIASDEDAKRETLEGKEAVDMQLVIVKRDGKYYWRSREDRELLHFAAGAMHFFIAPSGYIKIMDTSSIAALLDEKPPRYMYFEIVSQLLTTLTYHGIGTELAL